MTSSQKPITPDQLPLDFFLLQQLCFKTHCYSSQKEMNVTSPGIRDLLKQIPISIMVTKTLLLIKFSTRTFVHV